MFSELIAEFLDDDLQTTDAVSFRRIFHGWMPDWNPLCE